MAESARIKVAEIMEPLGVGAEAHELRLPRNHDAAQRAAVRKYLQTGEQPQDDSVLITKAYPQRTFVIAKDSAGHVLWAFFITGAKGSRGNIRLYSLDEGYLIAVEREEAKANPWSFQSI